MKILSLLLLVIVGMTKLLMAQVEPGAGKWKTWFISSGKEYRLPAPSSKKDEIAEIIKVQQNLDATALQQIKYWNAGSPSYRWQNMLIKLYQNDTSANGILVLSHMLLGAATYDAMVAAWDTKYAYNTKRPFEVDKRIKALVVKPESPSYPCEHSVAAGVAVAIVEKFYPSIADSIKRLAQQVMDSRVAAGVVFPSDTRAGFELGKKIANTEIEKTKDFPTRLVWDPKKMPQDPKLWKGKFVMFPLAGFNKTVVLESASQFRPGPPPDFAKEMEELKKFKPTFRSQANAFNFASNSVWEDLLNKKMFEQNIHLNAPRSARIYALVAITTYDAFVACWDAKFTYWGTRPNQYDTTYVPPLMITPPFPGYTSGHATISGAMGELYSYFFPEESTYFRQRAKDGAESRFQAGIHFRSDNEVGLEMGKKVANLVIQRAKKDGADDDPKFASSK